MSSKLDKSLDEIAGAQRRASGNRRSKRPAAAVAGGIIKKTVAPRSNKPNKVAAPAPASLPTRGDSKIIVSNLPGDVNEQQIKEYFTTTVGPVKRVTMSYNKDGRSTGNVTIIFAGPNSAAKAAKDYDGVKVDGRPMKIEVVMGARYVPEPPAPKTLKDRISAPKNATANKPKAAQPKKVAPAAGAATGEKKGGKKGRARRPKKTAEELDADMADYFDPSGAAAGPNSTTVANGAAAAAPAATNGGEAAMQEDEIM